MLTLLGQFRLAVRFLLKSPGFASVAVLTLALGVGANTAVFSLINAVLLRPLPYAEPDRLVLVWESAPFFGMHDSPVSPANYVDWKARSRSFAEMGGLEDHSFRLTGQGVPEVVNGALVTASFLRALRIRPLIGRTFRDDEDRPGAARVVLIGEGFWRRHYAGDPGILGRTVVLNEQKHTIVGVLAAGAEPPAEYNSELGELWAPFSAYSAAEWNDRGRHNWMVAARLRPYVTVAQANAEMQSIGAALAREYPGTNEKVGAFVGPLREHFTRSSQRVLGILFATAVMVLLIACLNLASLLLSRAARQSKEVAVRSALGAGVWQLARQFLCESLLLCAAGTALGFLFATSTFEFLRRLGPGHLAVLNGLTADWRVLALTLGIAALTTVTFGLLPLIQVRAVDLNQALKQSSRTLAAAAGSRRLRTLLICSEVALAFMLLIGAGLLMRTFARLRGVDVGCRTKGVLTMRIPRSGRGQKPAALIAFQREVLRRVYAIPGVVSAGFSNHIPILDKGDITGVVAEGHDPKDGLQCNARLAGPGFLAATGIPLLRGRDLNERDTEGAPLVLLINETMAGTAWPKQNPLGRKIYFDNTVRAEVVGVVGDLHQDGLDQPPKPTFYASALQAGYPPAALAIHVKTDPARLAGAVRQAIWSIDPDQPITDVATMEQILDQEVFERRTQMTLLAVFAGLALLLAAIGLYGVLAYHVGQQLPEIGMRMALGATPAAILRQVLAQGLKLAGAGIVAGAAGAVAVSRVAGSVLFEVRPTDPATYTTVTLVLLAAAAAASYLPARRAMRVDPLVTLREE
ncbi:MAG TPA: ABC transporter permease [Bryobacteraceae bacterium]|nr:ABC transporter permease [Bryobacteraceae bacterium]